jgi:hypothetical protein
MRLRRALAVPGLVLTIALVGVTPALADGWGNVSCGQGANPSCDLGAGESPGLPAPGGGHAPGTPSKDGDRPPAGSPDSSLGDRLIGGGQDLAKCSYVRSDFQPPEPGVQTTSYLTTSSVLGVIREAKFRLREQPSRKTGSWYVYQCSGLGYHDTLYRAPVWIPDGQTPGAAPLPSPQELAQQARSQLQRSRAWPSPP